MHTRFVITPALLIAIGYGSAVPCAPLGSKAQAGSYEKKNQVQTLKRKIRVGLLGYFLLPDGYKVYQTEDLRDAWSGNIVAPDDGLRINWTAGLVQGPFDDGEAKFVWVKRENIFNGVLRYGLKRTSEGDEVEATVGHVSFYAVIKSEGEMALLLQILRSYRVEKCEDCERPLPAPSTNKSSS